MAVVGGVITTGIYCRPTCSARPKPSNTRAFTSSAAAEVAGFRACHQCRPYRDELAPFGDAPAVVDEAVHLIAAGVLDDCTERVLAMKIGVSVRHLSRLFVEHIGVTPTQLARSRRAHFARRLLDDTDLRVIDIAFAAGFGSLRQLNRAMREVFHDSPLQLRLRRRRSDRLAADGGLALRLYTDASFDFDARLSILEADAIPHVEHVAERVFRRVVDVDGDPGVIEISRRSPSELLLVARLPRLQHLSRLVHRVRQLLSISPGAAPGSWDPFEAEAREVFAVGGQLTGELQAFVETFGGRVEGLDALGLRRMFPQPCNGAVNAVAERRDRAPTSPPPPR